MKLSASQSETLKIKQWPAEDRPREKMHAQGRRALSNAELLAIILGSGNKHETAVDLAKRILSDYNNHLHELSRLNEMELMKYSGIGQAKAIAIIASLELGRRRMGSNDQTIIKITNSKSAFEAIRAYFYDLEHEEFWVLCLNRANVVKSKFMLSKGGIAGTVADIKLIFKNALEYTASSIIVCHNHPSGNLSASQNDMAITEKIREAGKVLDIGLLDHLIISDNNYYSFADNGLL